jgi:hypothetical protein
VAGLRLRHGDDPASGQRHGGMSPGVGDDLHAPSQTCRDKSIFVYLFTTLNIDNTI